MRIRPAAQGRHGKKRGRQANASQGKEEGPGGEEKTLFTSDANKRRLTEKGRGPKRIAERKVSAGKG